MRDKHDMSNVMPTMVQRGLRFGMVFRDREDAQDFDDRFHAEPFQYKGIGNETPIIMLRVGPPQDPDERRRGGFESPMYTIMEANRVKG